MKCRTKLDYKSREINWIPLTTLFFFRVCFALLYILAIVFSKISIIALENSTQCDHKLVIVLFFVLAST
jgi:hypothetical protein